MFDEGSIATRCARWSLVLLLGGVGIATNLATSPPCSPLDPCPIDRVELEPASITLHIGDEAMIAVTVIDTEGNEVSPQLVAPDDFDWESAAPSVATVDTAGTVTAVGFGSSQIFVRGAAGIVRGLSAEALVAVVQSP